MASKKFHGARNIKRAAFLSLGATLLSACGSGEPERSTETLEPSSAPSWRIESDGDLNDLFDCLDNAGVSLVSAHRGGPRPGYPENAIETFAAVLAKAPVLVEIDVATSADGVLYLMHDDTLDRTTSGSGAANKTDWETISSLTLRDKNGAATAFSPPSFADALAYLRDRTITQIDFKRSTRFEDVIDEIYAQGAEDRVILIAYSMAQARKLHRLAPDMMISLSLNSEDDLAQAVSAGISEKRLLGFTGTQEANPRLYTLLQSRGVEVIFGTLGGRRSIDRQIARDGNDETYGALAKSGVDIIATDRPVTAFKALAEAGRADGAACGIERP